MVRSLTVSVPSALFSSECVAQIYKLLITVSVQGARRIVAEWPDLDQEARDFTTRIQQVEALEAVSQPLSPTHIEEVLAEVEDIERTKMDNAVPSSVDKESAAEL